MAPRLPAAQKCLLLHLAAEAGAYELCKRLLQFSPPLAEQVTSDEDGDCQGPLHLAAQ